MIELTDRVILLDILVYRSREGAGKMKRAVEDDRSEKWNLRRSESQEPGNEGKVLQGPPQACTPSGSARLKSRRRATAKHRRWRL